MYGCHALVICGRLLPFSHYQDERVCRHNWNRAWKNLWFKKKVDSLGIFEIRPDPTLQVCFVTVSY